MASETTPPTREEIAEIEVGHTTITRGQSWLLIIAFLTTTVLVPTVQGIYEFGQFNNSSTKRPQTLSVGGRLEIAGRAFSEADGGVLTKTLSANAQLLKQINEYEDRLEDGSLLTTTLLGPMQQWQARYMGVGNEQAYVGREGWLFYRPSIDYLTGAGFLEPYFLSRRAAAGNEHTAPVQPDPRKAILEFKGQLAKRGIQLVIMPTPAKPMIHPEKFSGRFDGFDRLLQNDSYAQFKEEMEAGGVLVFDIASGMLQRKGARDDPQFLRTDTHWTPDTMQSAAMGLAGFLREHVDLPHAESVYESREVEVTNLGDVAAMLQLPEDQGLYPAQAIKTRQVTLTDGSLWQPAGDSDVLLLGDSFTNIYSRAEMNWGESAGFAEQLSLALQRPIDRISQNDAGAHATRQTLSRELVRGRDRLAEKRVVVWQFAIRELAVGDWKMLPMKLDDSKRRPDDPSISHGELLVKGTVKALSGMPRPGTVPYRNGITSIHLVDIESVAGKANVREAVIYMWGMRDNKWTDAVGFQSGAAVQLMLRPWSAVERDYGTLNRVELDDPEFVLIDLPVYWAEEVK